MNRKRKKAPAKGAAKRGKRSRQVRMPAYVNAEEEAFAMEVPNVGLGRIFGIVLIMHIVAVGGILAFKWIERDTERIQASQTGDTVETVEPESIDETQGQEGARGIVSADQRPGYKRYRVASGDRIVDIARRFGNSVSEIERLNGIQTGMNPRRGDWITLRDRPDQKSQSTAGQVAATAERQIGSSSAKPQSTPSAPPQKKAEPIVARVVTEKATPPVKATPVPAAPNEDEARQRALQSLRPMDSSASAPQPPTETLRAIPLTPVTSDSARTYTVQPGDTAYGIATKFNTDWETLLGANGIDDPRLLKSGTVIRIP